jgi:MFS family permease
MADPVLPGDTCTKAAGRHFRPIFYGWTIVGVGTLLMATSRGICLSFGVYFTALQTEFYWNRATTSMAFSLYMMLIGMFAIFGGQASDKYGPKRVVLAMGVITGLSLVLTSRVQTPLQFYFTYSVLLALGTGAMYNIVVSTISRWFEKKRGMAIGIMGSGASLGLMVMAPISAWMIATLGWRGAYLLTGVIAWGLIVPAALLLKKDPEEIGATVDGTASQVGLVVGPAEPSKEFSFRGLLKDRNFWNHSLVWFFYAFCFSMVMSHLVPQAQDAGFAPIKAAILLSLLTGIGIPARILGGMVADKFDRRKITAALALVIAGLMLWLAIAESMRMFYLFAIGFGLVSGILDPPIMALCTDVFDTQDLATLMGILVVSWGLGSACGTYVAGAVFDHLGSYTYAFTGAGGGMILAAACSVMLKKVKKGG